MGRRAHDRTHTHAAGQTQPAVRRWDYLEVDVHVETWSDSAGRTGRLPIEQSGPGQLPSVLPVLNDLGSQGWELAGVSNSQSPLIYRIFLKRRAASARD